MAHSEPLPELQNARFLLEKARGDLIAFQSSPNDHALFNLLCTLNHLPNWVIADQDYPQGIKEKAMLIRNESYMKRIGDLCNRVKHFHKKDHDKARPDVRKGSGLGKAPFGFGGFGNIVYWAEGEGERYDILGVCTTAVEKWSELIRF